MREFGKIDILVNNAGINDLAVVNPGITGFVALAESNITLHTYPEKGYIVLDIFSCKEFDIER
jgi:S-adenosylmethionine/arginine decarboxylase-like enzyme